jgi:hypothetical protein
MDPVDAPRCANQVYVKADRSPAEASVVCSCPAGLIHMHDCPVTAGLLCRHFQPFDEAAEQPPITVREEEALRDRLMGDFLSRPYYHRVRSLAPQGDAWHRRRAELLAFYAEDDPASAAGGIWRRSERMRRQPGATPRPRSGSPIARYNSG